MHVWEGTALVMLGAVSDMITLFESRYPLNNQTQTVYHLSVESY